jgi:GT2 family glycosyltransferase
LSGCALALDRAAFEHVGGFDPRYFLYVEDVDLAVRLRAAGGRLVVVPDAVVVHEVAASTGARRGFAVRHHVRSLDRFVAAHVLTGPARVLRPLVRLGLAGWAASQLLWERTHGRRRGRSTTGE